MNLLDPDVRILEVHPVPLTRLLHRNSASGLRERDGLGVPLLLQAIGDAASFGYNSLHVAGSEPLHCPALHSLCGGAHRYGMTTAIELRQRAVTPRLIDELRGVVDSLGVVLDCRPIVNNRIRRCHRLKMAHAQGTRLTLLFTVTRNNLSDLEPAAQFAIDHGAAALTIRMLGLPEEQLSTAWMVIEVLRDLCRGRLAIGFETPNRYCLPVGRDALAQWTRALHGNARALGQVVSPLVIDSVGMVRPVRRDFPYAFAFGDLNRQSLAAMAQSWIARRSADFASAYTAALSLARTGNRPFHAFFDLLSEEAGRSRPATFAAAG